MNPDRSNGGMTLDSLLRSSQIALVAIPLVLIALIGIVAYQQPSHSNPAVILGVVLVGAVITVVGVLITTYYLHRRIKDRLLELNDICRSYNSGDRSIRAHVNGDDELAQFALSLNRVLEDQGGAQGGMNVGSGDAAALQAQIEKLLQEVSAVGDGDLRVQAEVTPDTLGVLADSFNYMIEELAKVVGRVQDTAIKVTSATRRILDGSADLAQASETQVEQISQTTDAVEALAVFIQNVARNAQSSAEVAQEALKHAAVGQQAVRQTIDGMMLIRENVQETSKKIKRLGERSNEISEIVRIIEDIADQTNLLALNAAIQSAMAGEHGRGFAVVADEIRQLAERSTESTKRIDTLVKSIQGDTYEAVVAMEDSTQEVVKGSQLADDAGRSLNTILSAVERQAQMIEGIARAANEQTTVSEAVAVAMGQISEITHRTNVGTQDAATSVSYLADLAEQLRASVSTFRLPEQGNEMSGAFPSMTPFAALPGGNGNQYLPAPGGSNDQWAQGFADTFPPLPEQGNSGPLVAASQRNGQAAFANAQDFDPYAFGSQPGYAGQQGFAQPQSFGSQPGFNGQSDYNGQAIDPFPGFGGQQGFEYQQGQGFGGYDQAPAYTEQPFGNNAPGFGGQGQPPFTPPRQSPTPPPPSSARQRWQRENQQQQGQSPFGQGQDPFSGNGQ
ncbi:MAG TPA: methyl-accepting chemotaxis protein [Ktedonobacteraceae bacterium]|nr:methyl-accepting chemotaxis protein [Ktedonobacteraceae bacterium]